MKCKYLVLLKYEVRINIMYVLFVYLWHKIIVFITNAHFSKRVIEQIFKKEINIYGKIR